MFTFHDAARRAVRVIETRAVTVRAEARIRRGRRLRWFEKRGNQNVCFAGAVDRRGIAARIGDALPGCIEMSGIISTLFERKTGTHTHTFCVVCVF